MEYAMTQNKSWPKKMFRWESLSVMFAENDPLSNLCWILALSSIPLRPPWWGLGFDGWGPVSPRASTHRKPPKMTTDNTTSVHSSWDFPAK